MINLSLLKLNYFTNNKQYMTLRYLFIQLLYTDSMKLMYTIRIESFKLQESVWSSNPLIVEI